MTVLHTAPDATVAQASATTTPFSLSVLTVTTGNASKRIIAGANGHPIKGRGDLAITAGMLEHVQVDGLAGLQQLLTSIRTDQALVHGVVNGSAPGHVAPLVTTEALKQAKPGTHEPGTVARSLEFLSYPDACFLLMFDHDDNPEDPHPLTTAEELCTLLAPLLPGITAAGRLVTTSTSSGIRSKATQEWLIPPSGFHCYLLVRGDLKRFVDLLTVRLWNAGYGYCKLATPNKQTGVAAVLTRAVVDLAVFSPERLDYVAGARLAKDAPFYQDRGEPQLVEGDIFDLDRLPEVTDEERREYTERLAAAKANIAPARFQKVKETIEAADATLSPAEVETLARQRLEHQEEGYLPPEFLLYFFHRKREVAVKDLSVDYDGRRLADPHEPDYRDGTDAIFHWRGGDWRINSFAHGIMRTYQAVPVPPPDPDEEDFENLLQHAPTTPPPAERRVIARYYYTDDEHGLWLVRPGPKSDHVDQLTNFRAQIVADIVEDDGTTTTTRFFEVEATHGDVTGRTRCSAKDFQAMLWVPDTLGPKARVFPGPYFKEHAHAAIQDLSHDIEHRHTYTHTGWRYIDGAWTYLHGAGAITAEGVRKDLSVALGPKFERYRLPLPAQGPDAIIALRASLALRQLGPDHVMMYPLSCVYLAPLRELLVTAPPDFVLWIVGRTGSYKSEYAALTLAHFGDFTRLTLPMTFETTGNGLERILHTPKDSLLVIDDYHPADSRREADAMAQVASRLLRGIGNMASRQRMRRDTTMQEELPPRCLALATGELVPNGHSNNARMFLVAVPPLNPEEISTYGAQLTTPQQSGALYAQAMATYLQWIAQHWTRLATELPARYAVLRQEAAEAGCHAREPGQVAYLQLAWETFTQCAVDHGALSAAERTRLLATITARLLHAVKEHAAVLQRENTVRRCLEYLRAGLASKQIYLRNTDDEKPEDDPGLWGWTPVAVWDGDAKEHVPSHDPKQAQLLGYVDATCLYLIPKTFEQYLHQAAKAENRPWPVDMTTLLRELEGAAAIRTKHDDKGHVRRELQKKINKVNQRLIHLFRSALQPPEEPDNASDDEDSDVPF